MKVVPEIPSVSLIFPRVGYPLEFFEQCGEVPDVFVVHTLARVMGWESASVPSGEIGKNQEFKYNLLYQFLKHILLDCVCEHRIVITKWRREIYQTHTKRNQEII